MNHTKFNSKQEMLDALKEMRANYYKRAQPQYHNDRQLEQKVEEAKTIFVQSSNRPVVEEDKLPT